MQQKTFDLSAKNPNTPKEIKASCRNQNILDKNTDELFTQIKELNL